MVPPTTVADRFALVVGFVPDLSLGELDMLAGATVQGHAKQIVAGKQPRAATVERFALVLGYRPAWLVFGEGVRPKADDVRAAVERARRRLRRSGGAHRVAKVSGLTGPRNPARPRSARA